MLQVTFNYRYNPVHELVKRTIAEGKIGSVLSVHFEWSVRTDSDSHPLLNTSSRLLDTVHGADYFKRWHAHKENSGGVSFVVPPSRRLIICSHQWNIAHGSQVRTSL